MKDRPSRFPRALLFDLDGTLLAPGAVLRRNTAEAVWAAAERGAAIVLATGGFGERTHLLARALQVCAPGQVWSITHNGAAIWDPQGHLVHRQGTPPAAIEAALGVAGRRVWVTYEAAGETGHTSVYYAGRTRPEVRHLIWGPQGGEGQGSEAKGQGGVLWDGDELAVGLAPRWDWRGARSSTVLGQATVLGCWCLGTPEALAPLDSRAQNSVLHGARYLPWGARLAQILRRPRLRIVGRDVGALTASKGAAAAWLCDRLAIDPADTAAFGDGDNDLELMAFAGTSVAMANGTPRARAQAKAIAPRNDQDGVARVLWRWLDQR